MEKKITVIGIGPGSADYMTAQARRALEDSDVIVGYTVYVDLVEEYHAGREVISTGMKKEIDRCRLALASALEGHRVAFVCSGDAGVYGMAGILLEVAADHPEVTVEVVPGITAALSGAALLGAPLIHDFALISLSDLLTPWEKIEKRLRAAAEADFVIVLYNPKSRKRRDYLDKAVSCILPYRSEETPCGYVRNVGRDGQSARICLLPELVQNDDIDMFTTVFIGNSETKLVNGRMVTPRGYERKKEWETLEK